uniref:Uncharacterized protein n=1 Tax=Propionibacterium freudenreichii TaxID=1744 RepID=A0A2C7AVN0_9ACTN
MAGRRKARTSTKSLCAGLGALHGPHLRVDAGRLTRREGLHAHVHQHRGALRHAHRHLQFRPCRQWHRRAAVVAGGHDAQVQGAEHRVAPCGGAAAAGQQLARSGVQHLHAATQQAAHAVGGQSRHGHLGQLRQAVLVERVDHLLEGCPRRHIAPQRLQCGGVGAGQRAQHDDAARPGNHQPVTGCVADPPHVEGKPGRLAPQMRRRCSDCAVVLVRH